MLQYIIRRLLLMIPIILGVSFLTFAISKATPGDPVALILGNNATAENVARIREQLHLDDPFAVQFVRYVWDALHGNLGKSIRGGVPVWDDILARFPYTLQLTAAGLVLAILGGVSIGIFAAMTKNRLVNSGVMMTTMLALSIPEFWLAIILILVFGVHLKWVSVIGGTTLKDLILPAFCLSLAPGAVLARLTRSSILEVASEDYVRTARSKGISERTVILRHILKNALIPVVTVIGLQFAGMLGGAVFIENVFARPGLGRFAISAIGAGNYPQIQGMVLFTAVVFATLNLAVDILYSVLDPRIRYS